MFRLVESQQSPSSDPLVLWLSGGPGCSSLSGFLTELGPFFPAEGGRQLIENIFSWNKVLHCLFRKQPREPMLYFWSRQETSASPIATRRNLLTHRIVMIRQESAKTASSVFTRQSVRFDRLPEQLPRIPEQTFLHYWRVLCRRLHSDPRQSHHSVDTSSLQGK